MERCRLCGAPDSLVERYKGPMRHSGIGTEYSDAYSILRCRSCFVEFIDPFPEEEGDVYRDGTYWSRKGAGATADIDSLHAKALAENMLWLKRIGAAKLAGKRVLDFGCGSGAFLDLIRGFAEVTVGIERDEGLAAFARARGHQIFGSLDEASATGIKADTVVSFDVLEHLSEPLATLQSINRVLARENRLYVGVPNQLDKLKELVPAYLPHFYHVEHLWYFDAQSLRYLFGGAGYHIDKIRYLHKYNFMNLIEWARTGKAPGNPRSMAVDDDLDKRVRGWLEDRGGASHLLLEASFV